MMERLNLDSFKQLQPHEQQEIFHALEGAIRQNLSLINPGYYDYLKYRGLLEDAVQATTAPVEHRWKAYGHLYLRTSTILKNQKDNT